MELRKHQACWPPAAQTSKCSQVDYITRQAHCFRKNTHSYVRQCTHRGWFEGSRDSRRRQRTVTAADDYFASLTSSARGCTKLLYCSIVKGLYRLDVCPGSPSARQTCSTTWLQELRGHLTCAKACAYDRTWHPSERNDRGIDADVPRTSRCSRQPKLLHGKSLTCLHCASCFEASTEDRCGRSCVCSMVDVL